MFDFLATLLNFFYGLWPSNIAYGMAIAMLTLCVLLIVAPLTFKQTKSMLAMQAIAPEVKAIQNKYKGDREKINEETMALYQAHGVNPLGGCLPLLVQLPIFLVLFNVVRGITRRLTEVGLGIGSNGFSQGFATVALENGNQTGFQAINVSDFPSRNFNPAYLEPGDAMHQSLSERSEMTSFGFDISQSALQALGDGILKAWPYLLLIVIVFVTSLIQQRQMKARRDPNAPVNTQQEMIMKFLPFMMPVFAFNFAAAVTIYFVFSNLFRVFQQKIITDRYYSDEAKAASAEKIAAIKASMPEKDEEEESDAEDKRPAKKSKKKPESSGAHGSRRPTSRQPRKRRANDPKNRSSNNTNRASGEKPTKPQKKSSGRVTPKNDSGSSRRRRGR